MRVCLIWIEIELQICKKVGKVTNQIYTDDIFVPKASYVLIQQ